MLSWSLDWCRDMSTPSSVLIAYFLHPLRTHCSTLLYNHLTNRRLALRVCIIYHQGIAFFQQFYIAYSMKLLTETVVHSCRQASVISSCISTIRMEDYTAYCLPLVHNCFARVKCKQNKYLIFLSCALWKQNNTRWGKKRLLSVRL